MCISLFGNRPSGIVSLYPQYTLSIYDISKIHSSPTYKLPAITAKTTGRKIALSAGLCKKKENYYIFIRLKMNKINTFT
jgi:hypothetical protein